MAQMADWRLLTVSCHKIEWSEGDQAGDGPAVKYSPKRNVHDLQSFLSLYRKDKIAGLFRSFSPTTRPD